MNSSFIQGLLDDAIAKRDALQRQSLRIEKRRVENHEAWVSAGATVLMLTDELERAKATVDLQASQGGVARPLQQLPLPAGTQSAIAARFGVTRSHVCRVAKGERRSPEIEQAIREEAASLALTYRGIVSGGGL